MLASFLSNVRKRSFFIPPPFLTFSTRFSQHSSVRSRYPFTLQTAALVESEKPIPDVGALFDGDGQRRRNCGSVKVKCQKKIGNDEVRQHI